MKSEYEKAIADICQQLFNVKAKPDLVRPEVQFGDFSTNVAMQLAGKLNNSPKEIAEKIIDELKKQNTEASIAGPGFINLKLQDAELIKHTGKVNKSRNDKLLLEYSCPNAFKDLHVGHLYQTILGDCLARVYERLGAKVYRVTYGGDVGLHVARSIWAIVKELGGENPGGLSKINEAERGPWLAKMYVNGTKADETASSGQEIAAINKRIYEIHDKNDKTSPLAKIYWTTRQWSYELFDQFYKEIKVKEFDRSIGESETYRPGLEIVKKHKNSVFVESDGAIVLDKDKSGLHTRVFVTKEGLATYEAKDLGVITLEAKSYEYDKRIIMTGNDQKEYMQVIFAALNLINPELGKKQNSVTHGIVKFGDGQKMSSRLGNTTRAFDVLRAAQTNVKNNDPNVALGAVKYTFLKNSIGGDISFDLEQSVSIEGNSGPYLQYALVRARSILKKGESQSTFPVGLELDPQERRLTAWLTRYQETLEECVNQNSLHYLCNYLYELSQVFNSFYETSRVIDDPRSNLRLWLVKRYEETLADGLGNLGIPTPEEM
jgi:arginyl-tRNA synthetase